MFTFVIYIDCVFSSPCICVFGSSRVESGTEPVEESYDFGTTQEDPSLDPSVGFYPGEPLYLCYLYFAALPLSIILQIQIMQIICLFCSEKYKHSIYGIIMHH